MYKRVLIFGIVIIGLATAVVRAQDYVAVATAKESDRQHQGHRRRSGRESMCECWLAEFSQLSCVLLSQGLPEPVSPVVSPGKERRTCSLTWEASLATTNVAGGTCTPLAPPPSQHNHVQQGKQNRILNPQGVPCDGGVLQAGLVLPYRRLRVTAPGSLRR
jgi:hypothetical protein